MNIIVVIATQLDLYFIKLFKVFLIFAPNMIGRSV